VYSAVTPRPIICGSSIYGAYRATNTKGMNKMACIDFLIWIGKPRAHGIGVYETIDGYIKESKNMGCCRRIPQVPSWAVLGQSRVFLVHQGNHKRLGRGSIFGYYTLERIEFITKQSGPDPIKPRPSQFPWSDKYYQEFKKAVRSCRGSTDQKAFLKDKFPKKLKRNFPRDVSKEEIRFRDRRPESYDGDPFTEIEDEAFKECMDECWKEFQERLNSGDYALVPAEQADESGGLGCSKRIVPGAIYLVSALSSEITNAFHEKLYGWLEHEGPQKYPEASREELIGELKKTESKIIYPEEGVELFRDAKREVLANRKPKEGELAVFSKPYPIFQRSPRAAFRGYLRIDGDKLLEQINKGGRLNIPSIPYCAVYEVESNKPMTKAQLRSYFATELGLQKTMANNFFDKLYELVCEELKRCQSIALPGLGRLVLSERKERHGINPSTREAILIPARKVVKFRPTKRIKDEMNPKNKV